MTKGSSPLDGSSFTARQVWLLKMSIAIMTALLILGILALIYGMSRQASKIGTEQKTAAALPAEQPYSRVLELGNGQLAGVTASGNALILYWKGDGADTIVSIDPRNGHELGRIQVPRR